MDKPKKWTEVYPHGTKEGDEESRFFRALARHPKYDWRSTGAIVKNSKLPQEKVEELIDKYINMSPPLIFPHPKNEGHWGYWERVPDMLKDDDRDLSTKDKDHRIGKHLGVDVTFFADEDDIFPVDDAVVADISYPMICPLTGMCHWASEDQVKKSPQLFSPQAYKEKYGENAVVPSFLKEDWVIVDASLSKMAEGFDLDMPAYDAPEAEVPVAQCTCGPNEGCSNCPSQKEEWVLDV